jgi:hypothetical protein
MKANEENESEAVEDLALFAGDFKENAEIVEP